MVVVVLNGRAELFLNRSTNRNHWLLINLVGSLIFGKEAGKNPWRALTLEWTTSSPPPDHNFDETPIPAPDPYGYGTPEGAAYLASEGKIAIAAPAAHDHGTSPAETPVAGD